VSQAPWETVVVALVGGFGPSTQRDDLIRQNSNSMGGQSSEKTFNPSRANHAKEWDAKPLA